MKKKLLLVVALFTTLILVLAFSSCGKTVRESEGLEYELTDDGYMVTGIGTCTDSDIVIPNEYNGIPVIGISDLGYCEITSITMGDNIEWVSDYAFRECKGLAKYVSNEKEGSLNLLSFVGCVNMFELYDLREDPFTLEKLESASKGYGGQFVKNGGLDIKVLHTNAKEKSAIKKKGDFVFGSANGEKYLISCTGEKSNVYLPRRFKAKKYYIGRYAFAGAESLESVQIPSTVLGAERYAFSGSNISYNEYEGGYYFGNKTNPYLIYCGQAESTISTIHKKTRIICGPIYNYEGEEIVLPKNVRYIATESVNIEGKSLVLGKKVAKIEEGALYGEGSLGITVHRRNLHYKSLDGSLYTKKYKRLVRYAGDLNEYRIPKKVKEIGVSAFYDKITTLIITKDIVTPNYGRCFVDLENVIIEDGVQKINDYAFSGCTSLTSIVIPDSVTSIGNYAFNYCDSLESIEIPSSVTSIGNSAFNYCDSLESIEIPNSVTSIGDNAFRGCRSLTSVTIPDSVTSIGNYAFYGCRSLTSVTIPDSVTSIGNSAFYGCDSLTSVTIPDSVTSIGENAFGVCYSLSLNEYDNALYIGTSNNPYLVLVKAKSKSILTCEINENTQIIHYGAFEACALLSTIVIPNNIMRVDSNAFSGCISLKDVTVSENITIIPQRMFAGCVSLENVVIPNKVTEIGDYAFTGCQSLKEITIPSNVTSVGYSVFSGCESLESITLPNVRINISDYVSEYDNSIVNINVSEDNEYYQTIDGNLYTKDGKTLLLYCPGKNEESFEIPQGVTTIGEYAFAYCTSLTSITIPKSVTKIHEHTFFSEHDGGFILFCEAEHKPDGWSDQWVSAENCYVIWNSNYDINNQYAYKIVDGILYCIRENDASVVTSLRNLKHAEILSSVTYNQKSYPVTEIESDAFNYSSNLESLVIPSSITTIDNHAIIGENLIIYCEVESKPDGWYDYWESVRIVIWDYKNNDVAEYGNIYITIDDVMYSIEDGEAIATNHLDGGMDVIIQKSITYKGAAYPVTRIAESIFYGYSLKNLNYLGSVEDWCNLEVECLYQNYYNLYINGKLLTDLVIPSAITEIKPFSFNGCISLRNVEIPNTVTVIGESAFSRCIGIRSINIPNGITEISPDTFYECRSLEQIVIPDGVTIIGESAFSGCISLKSISIPSSVTTIEINAFASIPMAAFNKYDNAYYLGNEENPYLVLMFTENIEITSCKINEGAKIIMCYAFSSCKRLESIELPNGLVSIGRGAFSNCQGLTRIKIPKSVEIIETGVFYRCECLVVYCEADKRSDGWDGNWNDSNRPVVWDCNNNNVANDGYVYVNIDNAMYGLKEGEATLVRPVIESDTFTINESISYSGNQYFVTKIAAYAFWNHASLTSIVIPDSVTYIGNYAFYDCGSLTSIVIPNSVTSIGSGAFHGCTSLASIVIPNSVTRIGNSAFDGCDSLTSIVIPDSVTYIGDGAFAYCDALTSIVIPNSVTYIGNRAFVWCNALTIYCEAESMPNDWDYNWNSSHCPVVLGYKG